MNYSCFDFSQLSSLFPAVLSIFRHLFLSYDQKTFFMKQILLITLVFISSLSLTPKEIQWVAIGDSITYLNDHHGQTGNRITKGYLTLITEEYPQVKYTNQGHNGWTAINIADKI